MKCAERLKSPVQEIFKGMQRRGENEEDDAGGEEKAKQVPRRTSVKDRAIAKIPSGVLAQDGASSRRSWEKTKKEEGGEGDRKMLKVVQTIRPPVTATRLGNASKIAEQRWRRHLQSKSRRNDKEDKGEEERRRQGSKEKSSSARAPVNESSFAL